jgi:hypothetical protein
MAVFTVHQPPLGKNDNAPDPARFVFVRDGFYVWGFLLSVLWMLRHRLWLVALLFVALTVLIEIGLRYAGVNVGLRSLVMLALSFLVGLEGATLRRWTLALKGYMQVGVVIADNREDAEQRFFVNWTAARQGQLQGKIQGKPAAPSPAQPELRPRNPATQNPANDVIGSFPQPEPPR